MALSQTLAGNIWPQTTSNSVLRNVVLAVVGSLIVAAAAQIRVPFWPVPLTLQVLAVLLIGGSYGSKLGLATLLLFAVEGAVGFPVLSGFRAGIFDAKVAWLLYPSFGYLIGFMIAAFTMGRMVERGYISSPSFTVFAALGSTAMVYIPGIAWLAIWATIAKNLDFGSAVVYALANGFVPFIPADILKALIAGLGLTAAWSTFKRA